MKRRNFRTLLTNIREIVKVLQVALKKLKESISIKDNELKSLKLIHKNNTVSLCKQHKKEKAKLFSEIYICLI